MRAFKDVQLRFCDRLPLGGGGLADLGWNSSSLHTAVYTFIFAGDVVVVLRTLLLLLPQLPLRTAAAETELATAPIKATTTNETRYAIPGRRRRSPSKLTTRLQQKTFESVRKRTANR